MTAHAALVLALVALMPGSAVAAARTERVSVNSRGMQGNDGSGTPLISDNGRYVAFLSGASNLRRRDRNGGLFMRDRERRITFRAVRDASRLFLLDGPVLGYVTFATPGPRYMLRNLHSGAEVQLNIDAAGKSVPLFVDSPVAASDFGRQFAFADQSGNIFVRDRDAGTTSQVNVSSAGEQANARSDLPTITDDGRYVAFDSSANNLVPGDVNGAGDVFLHDRASRSTTKVTAGNSSSLGPSLSADGSLIAFASYASDLVAGDTNGATDVFVHDRLAGSVRRVSVSTIGLQANGDSFQAQFIGPRLIRFETISTNLVPGDVNGRPDSLVHDLSTGRTSWAAPAPPSSPKAESSYQITFSKDGRWFGFSASSPDLVPRDTNRRGDAFVHGPLAVPFRLPEATG